MTEARGAHRSGGSRADRREEEEEETERALLLLGGRFRRNPETPEREPRF